MVKNIARTSVEPQAKIRLAKYANKARILEVKLLKQCRVLDYVSA